MSFTLYYPNQAAPSTTVALRNPERDNKEHHQRVQASGRTRGGTLYVYDKGTARKEMPYEFTELSNAKKVELADFFADDADGMVNSFQIVDHQGTTWNARFLQSDLEFTNIGEGTPPVTAPVWSVGFRLELSTP